MSFVISSGVHDFVSLIKLLFLTLDWPTGFFPFFPVLGTDPVWAGKSPALGTGQCPWGWAQGSHVPGTAGSTAPCPVPVPGDAQGSSGPSEAFVGSGTGAAMRA